MSGGVDLVTLAWALSSLLFLLSLWGAGSGDRRQLAALAGAVMLGAAAIYSVDVVNLPQIAAMLAAGGALGLMLGRGLPGQVLFRLMLGLAGLTGIAMLCAALAALLNPNAFGLLPEEGDGLLPWAAPCAAVTVISGAITALCAMMPRGAMDQAKRARLLALTGGLAGCSVAALGFLFQHAGLAVGGGLGGTAGLVLAARLRAVRAGRDLPRRGGLPNP